MDVSPKFSDFRRALSVPICSPPSNDRRFRPTSMWETLAWSMACAVILAAPHILHANPASPHALSCTRSVVPSIGSRTSSTPGGLCAAAPTCDPATALSSTCLWSLSCARECSASAAETASMSASSPRRTAASSPRRSSARAP